MPNPLVWFVDGLAELVVAYRENRMLKDISRHAWFVFCGITISGMYGIAFLVEQLP
jgi:hypothetical protein